MRPSGVYQDKPAVGSSLLPSIVNVELTNKCNLECVFCDHSQLKRKMKLREVDDELLDLVLAPLQGQNIYELGLVGLGEPLLDSRLERHLDIVGQHSEHFVRISLNTNGTLLDKERVRIIINSCVNLVTLSLNASNRSDYRKLMRRDSFELVLSNIRAFLDTKKQSRRRDLNVSIQVLTSHEDQESEMRGLLGAEIDDSTLLFKRQMFNKPCVERAGEAAVKVDHVENMTRYPCWSMYSRVYVDVNGNTYPCTIGNDCYREGSNLDLGNVKFEPLISLFDGPKMSAARDRAEKGQIPFRECTACTVWSLLPNNFYLSDDRWVLRGETFIRKGELDRND